MTVKIAKIVGSSSHLDYAGRVIDELDASSPPSADDYGFGQFVALPLGDEMEIVGVIYNSLLINPDYGHFGPRLSPPTDLALLSPDYLNERGVIVGILLLGWREGRENHMTVPRRVIPVGQDVYGMSPDEVRRFHQDRAGQLQIHYYSQVVAHAGPFGVPLLEKIIEQLEPTGTAEERQRLSVLKKSLVWQRTLGVARL